MIKKSKIRILQHNIAKSTNTMILCLKYAFNQKTIIILMQEPWIKDNKITIFYFAYDRSKQKIQNHDFCFEKNGIKNHASTQYFK